MKKERNNQENTQNDQSGQQSLTGLEGWAKSRCLGEGIIREDGSYREKYSRVLTIKEKLVPEICIEEECNL